jgi:hypothetical protein
LLRPESCSGSVYLVSVVLYAGLLITFGLVVLPFLLIQTAYA